METSEKTDLIFKSIIKFQGEIDTIVKDKTNPYFKSKYAGLPEIQKAIKPVLAANGLGYVQFPVNEGGLCTRILHNSGQWMQATYYMKAVKNDPQGWGSVITYQRRYALGAILGLDIDDDDDANSASYHPSQKNIEQNKPPQKAWLNPGTDTWKAAVKALAIGVNGTPVSIDQIKKKYQISAQNQQDLINASLEYTT